MSKRVRSLHYFFFFLLLIVALHVVSRPPANAAGLNGIFAASQSEWFSCSHFAPALCYADSALLRVSNTTPTAVPIRCVSNWCWFYKSSTQTWNEKKKKKKNNFKKSEDVLNNTKPLQRRVENVFHVFDVVVLWCWLSELVPCGQRDRTVKRREGKGREEKMWVMRVIASLQRTSGPWGDENSFSSSSSSFYCTATEEARPYMQDSV